MACVRVWVINTTLIVMVTRACMRVCVCRTRMCHVVIILNVNDQYHLSATLRWTDYYFTFVAGIYIRVFAKSPRRCETHAHVYTCDNTHIFKCALHSIFAAVWVKHDMRHTNTHPHKKERWMTPATACDQRTNGAHRCETKATSKTHARAHAQQYTCTRTCTHKAFHFQLCVNREWRAMK